MWRRFKVPARRTAVTNIPRLRDATDDLQLDLMEKDIVIEQLRSQLKQLRSKLAVVEEEQAADTAPLQGLLNQLGELKVTASLLVRGGLFVDPICRCLFLGLTIGVQGIVSSCVGYPKGPIVE